MGACNCGRQQQQRPEFCTKSGACILYLRKCHQPNLGSVVGGKINIQRQLADEPSLIVAPVDIY